MVTYRRGIVNRILVITVKYVTFVHIIKLINWPKIALNTTLLIISCIFQTKIHM